MRARRETDPQKAARKREQLDERHRSRERSKLVGLLFIALLILAIAFARFWRTIPWGAR